MLPTASSIAAEAAAFMQDAAERDHLAHLRAGQRRYPIINYEYAIVKKQQSSSNTAKYIRSLLEWAVNAKDGTSAST